MKKDFNISSFKEKLEASGQFPMLYMFKFIVPSGKEQEIAALFPKNEMELKASSGGKYVSTTIKSMMDSSDQIIEIYEQASKIEGLLSL
jgi:putative lipoic acid-binding regulatory protein